MQTNTFNEDELIKKLLPLTVLRRNAGEVLKKLSEAGDLIITKDGHPVAKLSALDTGSMRTRKQIAADIKKIRRLAGGLHLGKMTPSKINRIIEKRYEKMLPR